MRILRHEDFSGQVGQNFEVLVNGGALALRLDEAQPLPGSQRQGGGFRLVFRGPFQPQLPQGSYMFRRRGNDDQIFIVPISADERGVKYEAVFY
jgi:hypothetical protein